MERRFAQRLALSPLARTAIAILGAAPGIGLVLRAQPGPLRDRFMEELCRLAPFDTARRLAQRDIRQFSARRSSFLALAGLEQAGGGKQAGTKTATPHDDENAADDRRALILPGTDRYGATEAALLVAELGESRPAIAFDEGLGEETLPEALSDRLGIVLDLSAPAGMDAGFGLERFGTDLPNGAARPAVEVPDAAIAALCEAASGFGIRSLRAPLSALHVARVAASLDGRGAVSDADVILACRLVLAPRATRAPAFGEPSGDADDEAPGEDDPDGAKDNDNDNEPPETSRESGAADDGQTPDDRTEAAGGMPQEATEVRSQEVAVPLDLLQRLVATLAGQRLAGKSARKGASAKGGGQRGRPVGSRPGDPRHGSLDLSGTLTAALPWQRFRKLQFARLSERSVILTPGDLRIRRLQSKRETATIFVVDASGSAALARLAEAKGAVERILAECYRRRDRVAMVAFRGTGAETLLPETKSLTRARRALAGLAAGGGTPIASGIKLATDIARQCARQERTPLIVFLTDGKANIGLDGMAGRPGARGDMLCEASRLRSEGFASMVIDFSLRPGQAARDLADGLGARYLALPNGDASTLAAAVAGDATKAHRA
ncbi:VWA domain-containing protein [Fulvimarina sp. 2208YS6-2-32]|uniref:VWA domain-containing protein n=1 Tax=Fulvimarina uroteuthidis TaxID=3098149 RepID=A0ABU5HZF7_9HYPH|nr:VWA domain-containing protein [Fulvimarina sp. 2208YS6-2-32]MDY8108472.1 VWA domain-containing protein [Fulvimarina sp. 2208YS6-2-32]